MSRNKMVLGAILAAFTLAIPAHAQQPPPGPSKWPAQIDTAEGQVTIFQPQLVDFQGDQLSTRAAVSVQLNGQPDPVFGAIWLQDHVSVDQSARVVQILNVAVTQSRFPNPDPNVDQAVNDAVGQFFGGRSVVLSLDKLQASLDIVHKEQAADAQIEAAPPTIVFRDHPSVKVQYDGAPRLTQVDNSNLLRVINTPFFVVLDPPSRTYYLKGGGFWFSAPDPMGPFQAALQVPSTAVDLANSSGYQDPQQPLNAGPVEIVTATDPTELIWTDGPAQMGTISGTDLLYYANTNSDVFMTLDTQQYYVLLSGRWYTAPQREGPWAAVAPDQLPADFQRIPPNSDKADVLVSVLGTQAAQNAVADAFVPQTAAVDLHHFDQPPVAYDGGPNFQPIDGTDMSYAVNTDASVIQAGGQYYCCHDAVWYVGGGPAGPWGIAASVPAEIYTIPPSCPIYPVRFVYVYGHTGDAVYFGYLPGYVGSYVYHGVVVYGTGYAYRPWLGHVYYPRPYTYGFAAHYDWYTGHWGFDFGIALGGGSVWINTGIGDRFHNGAWFGHGGFHPVYARDAAHVVIAQRDFARDRGRAGAVVVNVYDHRTDVHHDLPGGGPGPREISRPPVVQRPVRELPPRESPAAVDRGGPRGPAAEVPREPDRGGRDDRGVAPRESSPPAAEPGGDRGSRSERPSPAAPPSDSGNAGRGSRGGAGGEKASPPADSGSGGRGDRGGENGGAKAAPPAGSGNDARGGRGGDQSPPQQ